MSHRPVTIYEIARLAGLSIATVSRVVNGFAGVSEKARARVQQVIAETGYTPNLIARDLTTQRSRTVGLVLPGINSYFSPAVQSISRCLRREGIHLLVAANSGGVFDEQEEIESLQLLLSKRVEGAIFFLTQLTDGHRAVLKKWPRHVELVLINEEARELGLSSILQDPGPGVRAAVEAIITEGRNKVAFIGGPSGEKTSGDRLETLRAALRDGGIPWRRSRFREGRFDLASGEAAALDLIATTEVDTLVCANDFMAIGALRALHSHGLRVPQDVAVIGYDDLEIGRFTIPALSTISPNLELIGDTAVALLARRWATHDGEPQRVLVPSHFVPRGSHAVPRAGSADTRDPRSVPSDKPGAEDARSDVPRRSEDVPGQQETAPRAKERSRSKLPDARRGGRRRR